MADIVSDEVFSLSQDPQCRYDSIRAGESAEVLVLSRTRTFETFKVSNRVFPFFANTTMLLSCHIFFQS